MKINLVDVDNTGFPNLALMKLSAWHKMQGDSVEFNSIGKFDKIYKSKVFTYTEDSQGLYVGPVTEGGIGYNYTPLHDHIEHLTPDYSLYNTQHAYGFITRGCIRNCSWCIVPKKEGTIKANTDIEEFIDDKKSVILMDNNILASEHGISQIEKMIKMKIKVDFNQGLDARLITDDVARLLSKVKYISTLRMSCDSGFMLDVVLKATERLRKYNCTPNNYFIYCLVKNIESALPIVKTLKNNKLDPFAQPYINFTDGKVEPVLKHFARWVNCKQIFKSVEWEDYKYNISRMRED